MSDDPACPESVASASDAQSAARVAEAAAIRRRWITLGEVLAVIAVVISGLTLWNSWNERSASQAAKSAEERRASARAATLVLTAAGSGGRLLVLKPVSAEQAVQSQTVAFPTALGAAPAQTTGEARIEAAWFEHALAKTREEVGLPDDSRGDERLPVTITTRFLVNGAAYEDVALYDIGYTVAGRWLSGHRVTLRGLSLIARVKSGSAKAKLEARWRTLFPHR